ncbi:Aminodeoxychorismate lyase [Saxophila tyrrhenica]|uniref:Aminodeoxychorismate lyase n=1 Tax=Saxophila tyrrhenica TaxID=1690608 RepID=A0AAV9NXU2_9PEZI|nr:Aminodeoxychorismate lyase [Saxophila tyrrhenica]
MDSNSSSDAVTTSHHSTNILTPRHLSAGDDNEEPYIYASIRYDPALLRSSANAKASFNRPCPFYLLEHQWTRLQVANWSKDRPPNSHGSPSRFMHGLLSAVVQYQKEHPGSKDTCLRLRIRSYASGQMTSEVSPPRVLTPVNLLFPTTFGHPDHLPKTEWTIVLDNQPTETNESTMYKTSDRKPYVRARISASLTDVEQPREVLIYNSDGEVLDATKSTPYFFRGGKWLVPASASGGLQGTTRRWTLENGVASEGVVGKDSLAVGETIWLSNGVWGFYYAKFVALEQGKAPPSEAECRQIEEQMRG